MQMYSHQLRVHAGWAHNKNTLKCGNPPKNVPKFKLAKINFAPVLVPESFMGQCELEKRLAGISFGQAAR